MALRGGPREKGQQAADGHVCTEFYGTEDFVLAKKMPKKNDDSSD